MAVYEAYIPHQASFSHIRVAFMNAELILDGRNEERYRQLLQEQRHIPRSLDNNTYGYRGPHRGRHLFFITDAYKLIVGGVECVPVSWHGRGSEVVESHILVQNLVVLPRYRQQGVATTLLRGATLRMPAEDVRQRSHSAPFLKMRAIIPTAQRNAIRLFCCCGWEPVEGTTELYEYLLPQATP